jgi:hypothetical protein
MPFWYLFNVSERHAAFIIRFFFCLDGEGSRFLVNYASYIASYTATHVEGRFS